jgi:RHS repeat-associated protein
LTTQTDPNGTVVSSTFDGDANTLNVTATNGATTQGSFTYTYDPADLVLSETDAGTGFPTSTPQSYAYTSTQRVASVNGAAASYTGAGSITGLENGVAQTYNADSQLTSSTPSGGSATTYAYNALGERTSATEPSTDVTSYTYDQAGNLTSFSPAADLTSLSPTSYTYSAGGLLASETTGPGTSQFIWDTTGSLPLILEDGTNAYLYGPSPTPFEQVNLATDTAASSTYLVADAQGSMRLQLSDSGTVLGTVTYDANGNPTVNTGVMTTPAGYDGQWTDPDTQLVYLRARWLDTATAQFVSVDPMVSSTLQAYGYAKDDPLNITDLTGLKGSPGAACLTTNAKKCAAEERAVINRILKENQNQLLTGCLSLIFYEICGAVDNSGHFYYEHGWGLATPGASLSLESTGATKPSKAVLGCGSASMDAGYFGGVGAQFTTKAKKPLPFVEIGTGVMVGGYFLCGNKL